ncbi:MAG TPA: hypothetical protein VKI62_08725 [Bacteroidota bacterium]|nr:hypothetical protein [Bacteroidota bacterium]
MKKLIALFLPIFALLILSDAARVHAQESPALQSSIFTAFFEDVNEPQSRISLGIRHEANPKVITAYTEKKNQKGTYSRTQYNVLHCEAVPCEQMWSASFMYTDEAGKSDTFNLTWKQTVFEGITPTGTSMQELLYCVNRNCKRLKNIPDHDTPQAANIGRYQVTWRTSSLVITRSDMK